MLYAGGMRENTRIYCVEILGYNVCIKIREYTDAHFLLIWIKYCVYINSITKWKVSKYGVFSGSKYIWKYIVPYSKTVVWIILHGLLNTQIYSWMHYSSCYRKTWLGFRFITIKKQQQINKKSNKYYIRIGSWNLPSYSITNHQ